MRIGLVLGGGGVVGLAYHGAALAALELDLGWDPRTSDVIVGTSAGSVVGALLRRGVPASDLSATAVGAAPRSSPPDAVRALVDRPEFPPVGLNTLLRPWRLPGPGLVAAWARRPWRFDPLAALATIVPDGQLDLAAHTTELSALLGTAWPEAPLWICAVRQSDVRRVVFGRDGLAPLASAVAASCAVPGYFRPVPIGGRVYIDGGVRSPTNADVLRRSGVEVALVVSPMSGRRLDGLGPTTLLRRRARRQVQAERQRLERAGIATMLIEPGPEVVRALGIDFMSSANLREVVQAAFLDAGEQIRVPAYEALVRRLDRRRAG